MKNANGLLKILFLFLFLPFSQQPNVEKSEENTQEIIIKKIKIKKSQEEPVPHFLSVSNVRVCLDYDKF